MNPVPEGFLLAVAGIAATLIGLLLVGVFFYVETGFRRATTVAPQRGPFLRATTKLTLLLYSLVLGISLGVVVLRPVPLLVLNGLLGLALLKTLVEWSRCYRNLREVLPIPRESPGIMWPAVVLLLTLPWVMDGWDPGRESMTWTLLGSGVLAVVSTAGLVLTSFDLASWEGTAQRGREPLDPPPRAHSVHGLTGRRR
jgi:hypothetical protein